MNNFNSRSLNLNESHPLIPREQTYRLSRKLLTVHAVDRDSRYYPLPNEFAIKCPQSYTNVQSIRLNEISFPQSVFNFSEKLNNNKFLYQISGANTKTPITISDGYYTGHELARKFKSDISLSLTYDQHQNKFTFTHDTSFTLYNCDSNISNCSYDCSNNNLTYNYKAPLNKSSLHKDTYSLNMGFLYTLGINTDQDSSITSLSTTNVITSTSMPRFLDTQPIYMEIDKYNLYDELNPFPKGSNNLYNNYSNSSTDTAFIKLQPNSTINTIYDSSNNTTIKFDYRDYSNTFPNNNALVFFDPPLTRLQNLKFKFRYHDGRLVDLQDQDVNFTLEINQLRDEIPTQLNIRTPA